MLKKKSDVITVQNTKDLSVTEYFVKDDMKNLGLAVAVLDGEYGYNKNEKVDQIMYIIEGKLFVEMNNQEYPVGKEDSILIKRGTWYFVRGKAKFVVITNPAWYSEQYMTRKKSY